MDPYRQPDNHGHLPVETAEAVGCTLRELEVVRLRNDDSSWRVCAAAMGISRSAVRALHARAVRRCADGPAASYRTRERADIGNERLLRGIPVTGYSGAIAGTRPGDDAGRAERDARLTANRTDD